MRVTTVGATNVKILLMGRATGVKPGRKGVAPRPPTPTPLISAGVSENVDTANRLDAGGLSVIVSTGGAGGRITIRNKLIITVMFNESD